MPVCTSQRLSFVLRVTIVVLIFGSPAVMAAPGTIILQEGDALAGSTVLNISPPFTDGNGKVGFIVELADTTRAIWYNTGVIFHDTDALPIVLTGDGGTVGVPGTTGFGNAGQFIYSPSALIPPETTSRDSAYTQNGILARKTDPAPGIPGKYLTFVNRTRMYPDGSTAFNSGLSSNPTGGALVRVFYRGTPAGILTPSLIGGTTVLNGQTIASGSGIAFNFGVSDDGMHQINVLDLTSLNNSYIYVDGALPHHVGDPTGDGDNWLAFKSGGVFNSQVAINNSGNYVFTGLTNGLTNTDRTIAYNSAVVLREGDLADGVFLNNGSFVAAICINNLNQVAHMWVTGGGGKILFVGDGPMLRTTSFRVLSTFDTIDTDGDGFGDWFVDDFNVPGADAGQGLDLGEDGFIYVNVNIEPTAGGSPRDAIVRLSTGGRRGDMNCDGKVDGRDVSAWVVAALDPGQYALDYSGCNIRNGDFDYDDAVEPDDISGFVNCILSGACP